MYLKSIEVQGFKSFANKIRFEFHTGITGIVGPNGSGKSNVADAVRWVLGEQRVKQLRGSSMQDVIFAGTELRKPLGFAYVAITLDNSDHSLAIDTDEVTVARKIYRSGESEYLMNGTVCRLKDVNELFYDTGIGKEGYSIIGQGQVERILSGKPEERRELFDEAAGIVKFKKRKAETIRRLDDARGKLVRLSDILSELEKQVGPLEKQSEKARDYLKKKEELKHYDINFFLMNNEEKMKHSADTQGHLRNVNDELEKHRAELEDIRREFEEINSSLKELDEEIEKDRNSLSNTGELRTKLEGQIKVLEAQIHSSEENIEQNGKRVVALEESISEKEKEKATLETDKTGVDDETGELTKARDAEKGVLKEIQDKIGALTDRIEEDKSRIIQLLNERGSLQSDKERQNTMLEQAQVRRAQINSQFLQARTNEEEQQSIIERLKAEFEKVNKEIEDFGYEQKRKEERIGEIHEELSRLDAGMQQKNVLYHQIKTRLESISNITERYEGYSNAAQKVMEKKEEERGIVGVVADIIRTQKEYETAIEIALGANIQNIVTEDEATAKRMIRYLKEARAGRATFLPLDSIRNPQELKAMDALKENGVVGLADEIVDTDPAYRMVAKSLLGRIIVVDDMDHALAIARKYHFTLRLVTLEGELLTPGGAISGGSFRNNSNLLGRRRQMDELEAQAKTTAKELDEYLKKIEAVKAERNQLRIEVEEIKARTQDRFLQLNTANNNLQKAKEKIDETTKGVDDLHVEQGQIDRNVKDIKETKEKLETALKDSVTQQKEIEARIGLDQEALEELRDEETAQVMKVTEKEVALEKVMQLQEFKQQNVDRIAAELTKLKEEKAGVEYSTRSHKESIEDRGKQIEEIQKTIEASYAAEEGSQKALNEKVSRRDALKEKQSGFFTRQQEQSERINDLSKEQVRLEAQLEKVKEDIENMNRYMWTEYEISQRDAQELRDPELNDISFLRKEIADLKDGIKKLGDVNVNAIEEYRNVSARYTEMKTQHDDLILSIQELEGIIQNLDEEMRKQFTEKFHEIAVEFDKVFKELFGGGSGTLKLMEDVDILEAGIVINAQPPGKKLQNMMQLSGGEKSLAAIALLFAIQNLKPSPFCLLDEIEAALDESNVGRYAGYLHKLTKHTQFIVITHRRGTMNRADRLYGITMQEKGVSTQVSVNLVEGDLED